MWTETSRRQFSIVLEWGSIFIALPIVLALDVLMLVKLCLIIVVILYLCYLHACKRGIFPVMLTKRSVALAIKNDISEALCLKNADKYVYSQCKKRIDIADIKRIWLRIFAQFFIAATLITVWVVYARPDSLFKVVIDKPQLWIGISFVYVFVSVIPQEYFYRVFFFARYKSLFVTSKLMIVASTVCFCIAHLMFHSFLVLVLTLVGGLLFSITYYQSKNYTMSVIEHSMYGLWLFTVGMGDMLAFPS